MTPSARVQAAIEIIGAWLHGRDGLDRVRTDWGRKHRFAGSGDRAAIADLIYDTVRRLRSAGWVAGSDPDNPPDPRDLLAGTLILDGKDPAEFFTGARHAPDPWAAPSSLRQIETAPRPVKLDYPDWLALHVDALPDAVLHTLRARAPLDLRVNTLKCTREDALRSLESAGITAAPGPLSPTAIRVDQGGRKLAQSAPYLDGLVEVQDAASQAVSDLAGARPGDVVLDLCAGGGGKTLALAAAMGNEGRLFATDIAPKRLAELEPRAARAGAAVNVVQSHELGSLERSADMVLVDAPCSGSGAWRRTPDAKWRLKPEILADMTSKQAEILSDARRYLKPGGRLVYATCSLFEVENGDIMRNFLRKNADMSVQEVRQFTPLDGGDGFYAFAVSRG